jgi:hypothetical protein
VLAIAVVRDLLDYRRIDSVKAHRLDGPMNHKMHMVFRGILILLLIGVIIWKFGLFH